LVKLESQTIERGEAQENEGKRRRKEVRIKKTMGNAHGVGGGMVGRNIIPPLKE